MIIVSVCMITYNHENYIREAIQSVLNQETSFKVEFIISNDASTDKTNKIINEFIDTLHNTVLIKYFNHKENIGMMPNFIFALNQCQGRYIALCEGDDYWVDSKKLQKQVDFLETHENYAGCFHNVIITNEMITDFENKPLRNYNKKDFQLKDTFSKTSLFHTSSFVFRKCHLRIPNWFKKVKSGDMALFALIAANGDLKCLEGNMGVYRKHQGGVTNRLKLINYHKSRIQLMNFFISEFRTYIDYIKPIKEYHYSEIKRIRKDKIKKIFKL